jgi:hypothetical protein
MDEADATDDRGLENSISIQIEFCIRPAKVGTAGIEPWVNDIAML